MEAVVAVGQMGKGHSPAQGPGTGPRGGPIRWGEPEARMSQISAIDTAVNLVICDWRSWPTHEAMVVALEMLEDTVIAAMEAYYG